MRDLASHFKAQGLDFFYSHDYDNAIKSFQKAISSTRKQHPQQQNHQYHHHHHGDERSYFLADTYNMMGYAHFRKRMYDMALRYFRHSVSVYKRNNHRRRREQQQEQQQNLIEDLAWVYYRMGKCFHESGRPIIASKYFEKANHIFESKQPFGQSHTITKKLRNFVARSKPDTIEINPKEERKSKKKKRSIGLPKESRRRANQTGGSIASDPTSLTESLKSCSSLGCGKISGLSGDRSVTFVPASATIEE